MCPQLDLSFNRLSGTLPAELIVGCVALAVLALNTNALTGARLAFFGWFARSSD
jgi:hypothetical protein